jgi:hypothetical protein
MSVNTIERSEIQKFPRFDHKQALIVPLFAFQYYHLVCLISKEITLKNPFQQIDKNHLSKSNELCNLE